MKFPLQQQPFAPVQLSDCDKAAMVDLAELFVSETLADYEAHLRDGGVDDSRWKTFKKFDNVTVYQDRQTQRPLRRMSRDDMRSLEDDNAERGAKDVQRLLWFGTVAGDLDDLMYAVVNPTAEEARVKSVYVGNNVLDFAVLASIVEATPEDPFRGLQLKWAVNGGPSLMRAMVRPRDFVYLESTGMTRMLSTGERVGFHILHSVEVAGVPELHVHKIVRGSMTLYHLYRQKSDGVVETYVKAYLDLLGDMPAPVGAMVSAKGVVSVWKLAECSQLKKLSWMLSKSSALNEHRRRHHSHQQQPRQSTELMPPLSPDVGQSRSCCSVCKTSISKSRVPGSAKDARQKARTCRVCMGRLCSRCCVPKKMCYFSHRTRTVQQHAVTFCIACVRTATTTNGREVALDELRSKHERKQSTLALHHEWAAAAGISPTSSSFASSASYSSSSGTARSG